VVSLRQPILGGDFMQFFTFGAAARSGAWTLQYDWPAFHALQTALVPGSSAIMYAPTYPPLVPALYLPLSFLPFSAAYAAWVALSVSLYCGLITIAATSCRHFDLRHAVLAALVFPPLLAHTVMGQSTIWPLAGFVLGWSALDKSQSFKAGLLLSLVAIKPHLGMALAVVLLTIRLWRVVGGVVLGLLIQGGLTLAICGPEAVNAYANATLGVLRNTALIEPQDQRFSHSLRMTLESLLPAGPATFAWLVVAGFCGWLAVRVWRRSEDWKLRLSALLFATLLISPHVLAYDAILLAPASLWLVDWAIAARRSEVALGVVALSIAFVLPAARVLGVPLTLPLMGWLLWRLAWTRYRLPEVA
jgi:alpha-1,2-mannosyltransferase